MIVFYFIGFLLILFILTCDLGKLVTEPKNKHSPENLELIERTKKEGIFNEFYNKYELLYGEKLVDNISYGIMGTLTTISNNTYTINTDEICDEIMLNNYRDRQKLIPCVGGIEIDPKYVEAYQITKIPHSTTYIQPILIYDVNKDEIKNTYKYTTEYSN